MSMRAFPGAEDRKSTINMAMFRAAARCPSYNRSCLLHVRADTVDRRLISKSTGTIWNQQSLKDQIPACLSNQLQFRRN
jgi:hypothetical protein